MADQNSYCRILIEKDGKMVATMPDGTVIPAQVFTRVSQDAEEYFNGVGYAVIKVLVNLKEEKQN